MLLFVYLQLNLHARANARVVVASLVITKRDGTWVPRPREGRIRTQSSETFFQSLLQRSFETPAWRTEPIVQKIANLLPHISACLYRPAVGGTKLPSSCLHHRVFRGNKRQLAPWEASSLLPVYSPLARDNVLTLFAALTSINQPRSWYCTTTTTKDLESNTKRTEINRERKNRQKRNRRGKKRQKGRKKNITTNRNKRKENNETKQRKRGRKKKRQGIIES